MLLQTIRTGTRMGIKRRPLGTEVLLTMKQMIMLMLIKRVGLQHLSVHPWCEFCCLHWQMWQICIKALQGLPVAAKHVSTYLAQKQVQFDSIAWLVQHLQQAHPGRLLAGRFACYLQYTYVTDLPVHSTLACWGGISY